MVFSICLFEQDVYLCSLEQEGDEEGLAAASTEDCFQVTRASVMLNDPTETVPKVANQSRRLTVSFLDNEAPCRSAESAAICAPAHTTTKGPALNSVRQPRLIRKTALIDPGRHRDRNTN